MRKWLNFSAKDSDYSADPDSDPGSGSDSDSDQGQFSHFFFFEIVLLLWIICLNYRKTSAEMQSKIACAVDLLWCNTSWSAGAD